MGFVKQKEAKDVKTKKEQEDATKNAKTTTTTTETKEAKINQKDTKDLDTKPVKADTASNNQKYLIPSTNAKDITWSSSNEKYPLLYKWSNGKTYKCDRTPEYCKVTNVNGKTVFKYKGSWDKNKNEDDCLWGIYVSYEGKTISLNTFVKQKEAKDVKTKK